MLLLMIKDYKYLISATPQHLLSKAIMILLAGLMVCKWWATTLMLLMDIQDCKLLTSATPQHLPSKVIIVTVVLLALLIVYK